jgi:inner membrane transporter RhtA
LSGLLFLHESLTLMQWLAIGSIILASVGATLTMRPKSPTLVPAD